VDNLTKLKERLAELEPRVVAWEERVQQEFKKLWNINDAPTDTFLETHAEASRQARATVGTALLDELFGVLDELCRSYLAATPEQRQDIRTVLDTNPVILEKLLYEYPPRVGALLESTHDAEWLRLGLAALSIVDWRFDPRDTYVQLGKLYLAAARAGLDPMPYVHAAAEHASAVPRHAESSFSLRDLFATFHERPYFIKDVEPYLPA
jgi:hypothetical protein